MKRLILLLSLTALAFPGLTQPLEPLVLRPDDRVLILAPHPDDDVLGCGGIIQRSVAMKLPLRVAYFTYGDNNEWSFLVYRKHAVLAPTAVEQMGLVRHDEAVAAMRLLGVSTNDLVFLGYPDFGTLRIWTSFWGATAPYSGMLTHASQVPYANAFRPGAPFLGQEIVHDLTTLLKTFKPTKVFVSHPADFNVDHRALYCFTRLALWELEPELQPEVWPYLVHFPHWPSPAGLHPDKPLTPTPYFDDDIPWRTFPLDGSMVTTNILALKRYASQTRVSGTYLNSFMRTNELFGDFATIRFPASTNRFQFPAPGPDRPVKPAMEEDLLTESERNGYVGIEWRHIQLESNAIKVCITLSRPLAETVSASIHVFGYRKDIAFESMPKIRIEVGAFRHTVHDGKQALAPDQVRIIRHAREIEAEIPLTLLKTPERLFVSARTYLGEIPLDWVSWRLVELK